jgi:hypothetical protein
MWGYLKGIVEDLILDYEATWMGKEMLTFRGISKCLFLHIYNVEGDDATSSRNVGIRLPIYPCNVITQKNGFVNNEISDFHGSFKILD